MWITSYGVVIGIVNTPTGHYELEEVNWATSPPEGDVLQGYAYAPGYYFGYREIEGYIPGTVYDQQSFHLDPE